MAQTENPNAAEPSNPRDPEDRSVGTHDVRAKREKSLDKTIADSFPTSDPPSSIPDPIEGE
jgi:hypothetical protein